MVRERKRRSKETTFLLLNPDSKQLNLMFYQSYDEKFLYSKALALHYMAYGLSDQAPLKIHLASMNIGPGDVDEKFLEAIRAELYFTAMHQFECFFALLLTCYQPLPHWLFLSTYQPGDIRKAAELFRQKRIEEIASQAMDMHIFLWHGIYSGFGPEEISDEKWQENLGNIAWLLDRIAERYINASESHEGEYNAYKHGLRFTTSPSVINMTPHNAEGVSVTNSMIVGSSKDSLHFLQTRSAEEEGKYVLHVTKHFNPEESFFFICMMQQMIENIKNTRLAQLTEGTPESIKAFFDMDKDYVRSLKGDGTVFRFQL